MFHLIATIRRKLRVRGKNLFFGRMQLKLSNTSRAAEGGSMKDDFNSSISSSVASK